MRPLFDGTCSRVGVLLLALWSVSGLCGQDSLQTGNAAPVSIVLKTYLEKSEIPRNESVNFHVELSWNGPVSRFQFLQIPQPTLHNLLLESSGSANRLEALPEGGFRATKTIMYQFKPVEEGTAYIEPITIRFRDTRSGESDALSTQRLTLQILPAQPLHSGKVEAIIYRVLLAIFIGTIMYFLVRFFQKRRTSRQSSPAGEDLESRYLKALSQEIDPKCVNLHDTALRLEKIFRAYLEETAGSETSPIKVGATPAELLQQFPAIDPAAREKLMAFFHKMEMVRFGGARVEPLEFSEMYQTIEHFLRQRQKQHQAEHV